MRLRDIMSHPVVTAPAFAPAEDGLRMVREGTARHLVLVDGEALAGVLCRCDFDAAWNSWDLLVDLRKRLPIWAGAETSARQAICLMRRAGIGCLPVLDGPALVGVVTRSDLRRALGEQALDQTCCAYCHGIEGLDDDDRIPGMCACAACRDLERTPTDSVEVGDVD